MSVHDKDAPDSRFLECLPLIEQAALDERDYVKKGVDMALRATGKRSPALRKAAVALAKQLSESDQGAQAWVGRSALRDLRFPGGDIGVRGVDRGGKRARSRR
ncbi:MAG: hypothetical protein FJX64_10070 [Alphaproteobacteria bacterium]|nr:hypothetical protein [Alphaproteobacteria bacterium]